MTEFYDEAETLSPDDRAARQCARLREILDLLRAKAPFAWERLGLSDPAAVADPTALAALPVLRKSDLTALQAERPPFGGLTTKPAAEFDHVFMSPGPIFEPGSRAPDWWRFARALHALGVRKGDIVHNCFAYHLTPAGQMFDSAARALGCAVLPGGIGATEQQVAAIGAVRPAAYAGTPDYLKTLLEKADEAGVDAGAYRFALVSGGALFPSLRAFYAERGVRCLQCYGTADLGLVSYETLGPDGEPCEGMVLDEGVMVEIVRPGTGDPVADGEVGEVVVTTLNADYPLIRFATGDLSAILPGQSPCGRTGRRIKGWMGRADQRTKIKGMFVDPAQVDAVAKRHPEIKRLRVVVSRDGQADVFVVKCESEQSDPGLAAQVAETVAAAFKLKGSVELVPVGSLPNDGKVIEDARDYDA
ncbi:MAG: AMP-binding protein [Pseudomonadota bacterium]